MTQTAALKILIVDDNEPSAKTLGWMLELIGHEIQIALDSSKGMEIAKQFMPDIVMLDIGLPVMNGYEVCAQLREDPAFKNKVFIAQTGWGKQEHRQKSKDAGFNHQLMKPIQLQQLQDILHDIIPASKLN